MNSRHEPMSSDRGQATSPRRAERIEDYLDHLCAPLVGIVPYAERSGLRSEAGAHIAWLVEEFQEQGLAREAATEAALREHGEPWRIGQDFADEWLRGAPEQAVSRGAGTGWMRAFVPFGAASVLNLLLIEACALLPGWGGTEVWLMLLAVLSPLVAGGLAGAMVPARVMRVVCGVQVVLAAHSFVTGCMIWPSREGLAFALFQLLFWLPMGCLSAWLTASLARHARRVRFCRITG